MENKIIEIKEEVISFIVNKLFKKDEIIETENISFFDEPINFSSKDMIYLFWFVESNWNISFEKDDLDNPKFYTLNGMVDIISEKTAK